MELDKEYDFREVEKRWQAYWETEGIYRFDPAGQGPVFSVDTPPPYVSADHLHVGHAMSYAQAEFVVRFQRMRGRRVFYPMGFDDNGLPTERYVEKKYGIRAVDMPRREFVELCLQETRKGAETYRSLWSALGLSVDWTETYSTIDQRCQRAAQRSFLELHAGGMVERRNAPIQWCPQCQTALAQADVETMDRSSKLHEVAFRSAAGGDLIIATTRPELLAACVALYHHPEDERYASLAGGQAEVPIVGHRVPIRTDESVDRAFGTGLMMVCTFGDSEDVEKWRRDQLDTRLALGRDGRLNQLGGELAGLHVERARGEMIKRLEAAGALRGSRKLEQTVSVHERCSTPIEFIVAPQWFIRVVHAKEEFLRRGDQLRWFPESMKIRYQDWVRGLRWDWNISRQRHYGVPFPVWYCQSCRAPVLARLQDLPVDPEDTRPPVAACPACSGQEFEPDRDVMDTWMTSSLSPLINARWSDAGPDPALYPMSVRVQAYEIIRTWLFYTVIKSHYHTDSLPWRDVMISGWGLNEGGKKISKRDLEATDPSGYNRYDPHQVIERYGADSLRFWATRANLGNNLRYSERDVNEGKRLLTKLWNASRFALMYLEGYDPTAGSPTAERTVVDRWVWHHLQVTVQKATEALERYDFAPAREATDRFFWHYFCDYYLEMIKDRFWSREQFSDASRTSAQATVHATLRRVLSLYAIFLPHITEELYQRIYAAGEGHRSIHVSPWPEVDAGALAPVDAGERVADVLGAIRAQRAALRLAHSVRLEALRIECPPAWRDDLERTLPELKAAARVGEISFGAAEAETGIEGLRLTLVREPSPAA